MSTHTEFEPFSESTIDYAADLLAARHARDRDRNPLLPQRFASRDVARAALVAVWQRERTSGIAAWRGGRLAGYLIGEVKIDTLRGRNTWMQLAGHALADGAPAELYAEMYAAAAPVWLKQGSFEHYVMVPASNRDGLDVWFSLSFGQEQAHALRDLTTPLPPHPDLPEVRIRLATRTDRDAFVDDLGPVLRRHMTQAPVWGVALPEYYEPMRQGFAELLADNDVHIWAAFEDSRMLAYQVYLPVSPAEDNLLVPEQCVLLEIAATLPEVRGRGIGRALTAAGLSYARERGFTTCLLDWRTTNRLAHRFWLGLGFAPAAYRLVRRIDSRIAWARD